MFVWPLALLATAASQSPSDQPARPKPHFSWDTIPIAFHGANRTGPYNAFTIETLAKYSLVTIEKWYTECGSLHPIQAGPECNVEKAMFRTFRDIKKLNPNVTTILYLNSMFDFSMYNLHGLALNLEARGERVLLRDKSDNLVLLCNDGNYYCNVTNFDWSKEAARNLWISEVLNATQEGGVDGIFADHAIVMLKPADDPQLCNGAGDERRCYHFTPEVANAFNVGHRWIVDHAQDMVAALGGPVINGPYARMYVPACDFEELRQAVEKGQNGTGPFVIEANKGGCDPDESCLAAFLCAAAEYTYLTCLADEPTYHKVPALSRPLGPPLGRAVQSLDGVWTRRFSSGTVARWNPKISKGTIQWSDTPVGVLI